LPMPFLHCPCLGRLVKGKAQSIAAAPSSGKNEQGPTASLAFTATLAI
jgi:hypothetical protein